VDWASHAERLASEVTHAVSRWRPVIAAIPRHLLVPRWWSWSAAGAVSVPMSGSCVMVRPKAAAGCVPPTVTGRWSRGSVRCMPTTASGGCWRGGWVISTSRALLACRAAAGRASGHHYHRYSPDHYRGQDRRWWGHRAYGMGRAGFMHTWVGVDYPTGVTEEFAVVRERMVIRSAWAAIPR
jgi:hypothetical protein